MLKDLTIEQFLNELSSDSPAPGGGSIAALSGAVSCALLGMVCSLTTGRKKYAEFNAFAKETAVAAAALRNELQALIDEDSDAYNRVSVAMKMPKETEEDKKERAAAVQAALKHAASVPLETMRRASECITLIKSSFGKTNPNAESDLGVALLCAETAVQAAWLNVEINLDSIRDEDFVREVRTEGERYLTSLSSHISISAP